MIIQLVERSTGKSFTCAQENYYCLSAQDLSAQIHNSGSLSTTGSTNSPVLTRRNLIGVLVIATLLFLGITLWLCFGKWSKPIRHFFQGRSKSRSSSRHNAGATAFGISYSSRAASVPKRVDRPKGADVKKVELMDSSSNASGSTHSQLLVDHKLNEEDRLELAVPAKVLVSPCEAPTLDSLYRLILTIRTGYYQSAYSRLIHTTDIQIDHPSTTNLPVIL